MSFTGHLESETENTGLTETTPLIPEVNRQSSLTRRRKLERLVRILGRITNPLNDAAIAGITLNIIGVILHTLIQDEKDNWLPLCVFSIFGVVTLSSLGFEIINSYKLSKHSQFILGESTYEHAKFLTQNLTAILGIQAMRNSQQHQSFEQWIMELKQSSPQGLIKIHLRDFETANRYNNVRRIIDNIATLVLGMIIYPGTYYIVPFVLMGCMFLTKTWIDNIEHNWFRYEDRWKKLSLFRKKCLLTLRTLIEMLYHFILGTSACVLFTGTVIDFYLFLSGIISETRNDNPSLCVDIDNPEHPFNPAFSYYYYSSFLIPVSIVSMTYTIIQLNSTYQCCTHSSVFRDIKRVSEGLVQGAKIGGLLMGFAQMFLWSLCFSIVGDNSSLPSSFLTLAMIASLISIISGLVTAVNTILNYQDPDANKMSTVDHDVAKLREEIVGIKKGLLKEEKNQNDDNMAEAMHDKSEFDPVIEHSSLENTREKNKGSLWNSLCCFWRGSNGHEDADRAHRSSDLRSGINFQSV